MSCFHGNHPDACDICDEVDAASKRGYEAGFKECLRENFTAPPQRKPLTDEEILNIHALRCWPRTMFADKSYGIALDTVTVKDFARAIEAEHGITGEHNGNV